MTDNSDPAPTLQIIEGLPSGSQFTTSPDNIHTVVYAAQDAEGNQAENCAFTIVVQGTERASFNKELSMDRIHVLFT